MTSELGYLTSNLTKKSIKGMVVNPSLIFFSCFNSWKATSVVYCGYFPAMCRLCFSVVIIRVCFPVLARYLPEVGRHYLVIIGVLQIIFQEVVAELSVVVFFQKHCRELSDLLWG